MVIYYDVNGGEVVKVICIYLCWDYWLGKVKMCYNCDNIVFIGCYMCDC